MIKREKQLAIRELLAAFPAVVLLGPRQVGKTTLALELAKKYESIYLDLESEEDRAKLDNPAYYFADHTDKLIILDEVQRIPELFQELRGVIDKNIIYINYGITLKHVVIMKSIVVTAIMVVEVLLCVMSGRLTMWPLKLIY